MIEIIHLEKKYENAVPLKDVSTVINDGDIISVIGPSGTGKSTLLRCINLLDHPTAGKILLDGEDITAPGFDVTRARRKMGMVFQSFNLFGHLTVIENLMMAPMDILGKSKEEAYDTGVKLLKRVGLSGRELDYPDQLSGGQQQRVAIARTLAMDPEVILFDEPTSALDPAMIGEVQSVIRDLADSGKTMLIVTHEMNFARAICNRVFYMDQGEIYEEGSPDQIFDDPEKELTRRFIRKLKVHEYDIVSKDFDFVAAGDDLDRYCIENAIPPDIKYRIRLATEEIVQQILIPSGDYSDNYSGNYSGNYFPIHVIVEYSAAEMTATVTVSYGGSRFDPADSKNQLSYEVLSKAVRSLEYTYEESVDSDDGEDMPNKITVCI